MDNSAVLSTGSPLMVCHEIQLKNFRCFESVAIPFTHPIVLLEGVNGAGKTSLLEALHYACYLRSFRTHTPKELVRLGHDHFFVRVKVKTDNNDCEIQVGFSALKRSVKIDQKPINSYKELMDYYRVVSLIEDDMQIIKGSPQDRRAFIDQILTVLDPSFVAYLREFRKTISSRNQLIQRASTTDDNYMIWTYQLWEKSQAIQKKRKELLSHLVHEVNQLITDYFDDKYKVICTYQKKLIKDGQSFDVFMQRNNTLFSSERDMRHSLFGAHLDDFVIQFENKSARRLASRGQQKLVVSLLRIAQARYMINKKGPLLFILDDFITDFDSHALQQLLSILQKLNSQLILTAPTLNGTLSSFMQASGASVVSLVLGKQ